MSININSEVECRKAYINYQNYGNTMGITADEFDQMTAKWSHKLESWIASASNDETEYRLTEEEADQANCSGYKKGEDKTGYDRDGGDVVKEAGATSLNVIGGAAMGFMALVFSMAKKIGTGKIFAKPLAWGIAAAEALLAASYWLTRPNKEGVEAAQQMQTSFKEQDKVLQDSQENLIENEERVEELAEETEEANEECSEDIEDMTEEVNPHSETLKNLKAKKASGVALTESEKMQYDASLKEVEAASGDKGTLAKRANEATEEVGELKDDMEDYQDVFDETAVNMEETDGMIEYARSFDTATRDSCNILGGALALNAAGCATLATVLFADLNLLTKATSIGFGAISVGAGLSNLKASAEQFKYASIVEEELSARSDTDGLNANTNDVYDESLDYYDGTLQSIKELGEELPKQYEEPIEELTTTAEDAATLDVNSGSGPAKVGAAPGATGLFTTPAAPWGQPATGTPGLPGGQGANPYAPGVTMTTAPANNNENNVNNSNNNDDPNNLKNKKEDEKK